jgi:hypothetical protein
VLNVTVTGAISPALPAALATASLHHYDDENDDNQRSNDGDRKVVGEAASEAEPEAVHDRIHETSPSVAARGVVIQRKPRDAEQVWFFDREGFVGHTATFQGCSRRRGDDGRDAGWLPGRVG